MELLAPAGNWEAFLAAMANGADAVYLGGQSFSARHYAENFNKERIDDALNYAHLRNKKVYVTVNTLIADHEFASALDYIRDLYKMGVDAVIVQDIGLTHALRKLIPDLRLHASTQMTVHNSAGAILLREEGVKRVVLAREMSRDELAKICCEVKDIEFEVFVHGALCYSYSGQCLFSSLVGGRSGNRGRCAQPCRLAYQLFSRTEDTPVASEGRHLLSPADLCLIEQLGDLQRIGIHSLKIEGRMKRAEYVAVVTRAYREVLDSMAVNPGSTVSPELRKRLERIFNRNFTAGYFLMDRAGYLSPKRPNNRGIYIGRVVEQSQDFTTRIKLTEELRVGDGLEIWVKKGQGPAFTVKDILLQGKRVSQAESGDIVNLKIEGRAGAGDRVFKTYDSELMENAQASIEAASRSKLPLDILVSLQEGESLSLLISDGEGRQVKVKSTGLLQKAEKHPLTSEETAWLMNSMLQTVVSSGTGTNARVPGVQTGGKTGTSEEYKDSWFCGVTPGYSAAIWMGYDREHTMNKVYGGSYPARMFRSMMQKAHEIKNPKPRSMPAGIVSVSVCSKSGKLPAELCSQEQIFSDYCLKNKVPTEICDAHNMVSICPESGKLAGRYCPNPEMRSLTKDETPTEKCDIHSDFSLPALLNNEIYVCRDPRHNGKIYRANIPNPLQSGGCPPEYLEKVIVENGDSLPYCSLEDHQLKKKKAREVFDDVIGL
jgi:collagenase-like PrtC family protease